MKSLMLLPALAAADLLEGRGSFTGGVNATIDSVLTDNEWEIITDNHEKKLVDDALELSKAHDGVLAYNDGIMLKFETARPKHVRLQVQTSYPDNMDPPGLEACNVRLTTVNDLGES